MTSLAPAVTSAAPSGSGKIRVMVVDDSAVVRGLVSRWVDEDPGLETVGRFANGQLALAGIAEAAPDVVILDIDMPVMDGMTALPELLKLRPGVKIIIASTLTLKNAEISLKALSLGATDYIPKPGTNSGITTSLEFRSELLRKVKAMAPGKCRASREGGVSAGGEMVPPASAAKTATYQLRPFSTVKPGILAIGSSTGGPQALTRVLQSLSPVIADIPTVITQHMPPTFTSILAEHLARSCGRTVKEGGDGELVVPGTIYVAPGGLHMSLVQKDAGPVLQVYDGPVINYCKPSVDPLFESVVKIYGPAVLALVLTGMGHDGARGARMIADAGGSVIVQDEATSVVWGMPGAVAEAGACAAILPLDEIGPRASTALLGGIT